MIETALIPWLDPATIIPNLGAWALFGVCAIIFAETALLVGFLLPGDTLLFFTGLLTFTGVITYNIWWTSLAIGLAAFLGGEVGYLIGHKAGPRIFERKESGLFSKENVKRTNAFFERFGGMAVILARFVPVVRTFTPVAAGVAHMNYRKYSLYNLIGAVVWGMGLTMLGYLLGQIPWVEEFATKYMDLVILGAVLLTAGPTIYHYARSARLAKKRAQQSANDNPGEGTEGIAP
ncbi:VTT domain-containing protein [Lysinibacter sp. HNR]|uniref:DedA family protein n=1 Tax=Lysinibacter sp. HNR TaxID=3031408 RepID=UPI002434E894|nr:VTT domain-containing protein [Lysinibacter sp. HNR]WGD37139.1 VTT domain-containing protein [Lysinibacter sp. HNR]